MVLSFGRKGQLKKILGFSMVSYFPRTFSEKKSNIFKYIESFCLLYLVVWMSFQEGWKEILSKQEIQ